MPVPSEAVGEQRGDRLLYDCQRSSAVYLERCDDCPGCRQIEQSTKTALRIALEAAEDRITDLSDALHEAQMEAEHHREQERFWKGRCEELEAALEEIRDRSDDPIAARQASDALTPCEAGVAYDAMQNLRGLFPQSHSSERYDSAEAKLRARAGERETYPEGQEGPPPSTTGF